MKKPSATDRKYYNIMDGRGGEFNLRMYLKDMEALNNFQDIWLITATVKNRRRYFYIEASLSHEAIKIFNKNYPGIQFRNCKKLEQLT